VATQSIDATGAIANQTFSQSSVDTDGTIITAPASTSAIYARMSVAGVFSVGGAGAAEVPLDANTWTLVWQQSAGLANSPIVYVAPSSGTATVFLRVV